MFILSSNPAFTLKIQISKCPKKSISICVSVISVKVPEILDEEIWVILDYISLNIGCIAVFV